MFAVFPNISPSNSDTKQEELISQLGSQVNKEAVREAEGIRRHGWLTDGWV